MSSNVNPTSGQHEVPNQFVASLRGRGVSRRAAEGVLARLRRHMGNSLFDVKPDQRLYETYGLIDEDLNELAIAVLKEAGGRIPSRSEIKDHRPVETVEELVVFLSEFVPE